MSSSPIVVLGARIVDGHPSRMLHARLCAALVRWRTDARAGVRRTIVVTGLSLIHISEPTRLL